MKKIPYIVLIAVVALTACRKEEVKVVADGTITVTTAIGSAETRTVPATSNVHNYDANVTYGTDDGAGTFKDETALGMFVTNTYAATETVILSNAEYKVGASYYWQDLGAPRLRFAAYYPKQTMILSGEGAVDPAVYLWTLPTTTAATAEQEAAYVAADLLVATDGTDFTSDPKDNDANLIFRHAAAKVIINIENQTGDGDKDFTSAQLVAATVTLTAKSAFTVNLTNPYTAVTSAGNTVYTYAIAPSGDATAVAPLLNRAVDYTTIAAAQKVYLIAPQTLDGKVVNIEIDNPITANKTIAYSFSLSNVALASNQKLTLNLEIGLNEITLSSYQISSWDNTNMDGDVNAEFGL